MKTSFAFLVLVMFIFGCGSRSGHRVPKSQTKDSLATASADTTDSMMTTRDSMKLLCKEIYKEYTVFLNENRSMSNYEGSLLSTFNFVPVEGGEEVSIDMFTADTVYIWMRVSRYPDFYTLSVRKDDFLVRKHDLRYEDQSDSLLITTSKELELALLPFQARMHEARLAVAKMKKERIDKLDRMVRVTNRKNS